MIQKWNQPCRNDGWPWAVVLRLLMNVLRNPGSHFSAASTAQMTPNASRNTVPVQPVEGVGTRGVGGS